MRNRVINFTLLNQSTSKIVMRLRITKERDRKSTRLNSSHANNSYAASCLKKKEEDRCERTDRGPTHAGAGSPLEVRPRLCAGPHPRPGTLTDCNRERESVVRSKTGSACAG